MVKTMLSLACVTSQIRMVKYKYCILQGHAHRSQPRQSIAVVEPSSVLQSFVLLLGVQADEMRRAQLEAHGNAAVVSVDGGAVTASGPASYAPTM